MFRLAGEYVVSAATQWCKHLAGPFMAVVSLGSLAYIHFCNPDAEWVHRISGASLYVALAMIPVAQYSLWKAERLARERVQAELSKAADIQGTIYVDYIVDTTGRQASTLTFKCDCANFGKKACQISKIIWELEQAGVPTIRKLQMLHDPSAEVVEPDKRFALSGHCVFQEVTSDQLREAKIAVFLMDSVGVEHRNIKTARWTPSSVVAI